MYAMNAREFPKFPAEPTTSYCNSLLSVGSYHLLSNMPDEDKSFPC